MATKMKNRNQFPSGSVGSISTICVLTHHSPPDRSGRNKNPLSQLVERWTVICAKLISIGHWFNSASKDLVILFYPSSFSYMKVFNGIYGDNVCKNFFCQVDSLRSTRFTNSNTVKFKTNYEKSMQHFLDRWKMYDEANSRWGHRNRQ
jgi:hypothetical protein